MASQYPHFSLSGFIFDVAEVDPAPDLELHRRSEVAAEDSGMSEPVSEASPKLRKHGIANRNLQTGAHQNGGEWKIHILLETQFCFSILANK